MKKFFSRLQKMSCKASHITCICGVHTPLHPNNDVNESTLAMLKLVIMIDECNTLLTAQTDIEKYDVPKYRRKYIVKSDASVILQ